MNSIFKKFWLTTRGVVGFSKTYNFVLWFIFSGALLGFTLARLQYLHVGTYARESAPGEWYFARKGRDRIGIFLHLGTILPCGILAIFQFIPTIRHRWILFHRINGYIIYILFMLANAGALMIMSHAFGGGLDVQTWVVTVVAACTISIGMAWYNIRRLQIDQHRAWMLRAMFYMSCIVTLRLLLVILATIVSRSSSLRYGVWSCDEIRFTYGQENSPSEVEKMLRDWYPNCSFTASTNASSTFTPIKANLFGDDTAQGGIALNMSFGSAGWIAFFLHLVGIEIYLRLTPKEAERLRMVSYERQMAAGYKNPGSAGLVVETWGDAKPWNGYTRNEMSLDL